jgi:outer membrane lipoprotein carrier protein
MNRRARFQARLNNGRTRRVHATMKLINLMQILIIPSILFAGVAHAEESVSALVNDLQRRYASVDSLSARFQQTYRGPGIDQTESGQLWMKKPGLMRWEYRMPETKLFIADGRNTFFYVPEDRQVLVRSVSLAELHSTPLQFLLGQGSILKSFAVSWDTEWKARLEGTRVLRLTPRSSASEYEYLVIEVDAKTNDLRRMVIREHTGNTSEFVFSDLATNVKVDKKNFRFSIPKGVEVIRLDEK